MPELRAALAGTRPEQAALRILLEELSPLPELARRFAAAQRARAHRLRAQALVEALLADGLLVLCRQLSRGNTGPAELLARWAAPTSRPAGPASRPAAEPAQVARPAPAGAGPMAAALVDPTPALREKMIQARLRRDLSSVTDRPSLERLLQSLPPPHPQYRLLQAVLPRYRALVEQGGWKPVPALARLPRQGRRHPLLPRLKQRLAAEGYLAGPLDDSVDAALLAALREYQRSHQLLPTGKLDGPLLASLNVPAAERLQSILLTLQRWRESLIGDHAYYLLVNVPDFSLEVWKQGRLWQRQRVVVGKNSPERCDEETEQKVLAHATPLQGGRLRTMVFSPYWNVTRTIRETELEPERGKDPEFYEKNGYEIMQPGREGEWVRQLPGPQNPLGFIKLLFPNPHETYLHDTPEKGLFQRPRRAFSHGCIRVEDAWRLAEQLLRSDGQWEEARFRALLREWKSLDVERLRKEFSPELYRSYLTRAARMELLLTLKQPVPIFVEYYTVRVEPETGRVHFLADLYGLDQRRRSGGVLRSCIPESTLARRRFSQLPARLETLERRARELRPGLQRVQQAVSVLPPEPADPAQRRLLRRARALAKFSQQVSNLAERIRARHEVLADRLGSRVRSWSERQIAQAVSLERLVGGLEKLLEEAAAVTRLVPAAAAP